MKKYLSSIIGLLTAGVTLGTNFNKPTYATYTEFYFQGNTESDYYSTWGWKVAGTESCSYVGAYPCKVAHSYYDTPAQLVNALLSETGTIQARLAAIHATITANRHTVEP